MTVGCLRVVRPLQNLISFLDANTRKVIGSLFFEGVLNWVRMMVSSILGSVSYDGSHSTEH